MFKQRTIILSVAAATTAIVLSTLPVQAFGGFGGPRGGGVRMGGGGGGVPVGSGGPRRSGGAPHMSPAAPHGGPRGGSVDMGARAPVGLLDSRSGRTHPGAAGSDRPPFARRDARRPRPLTARDYIRRYEGPTHRIQRSRWHREPARYPHRPRIVTQPGALNHYVRPRAGGYYFYAEYGAPECRWLKRKWRRTHNRYWLRRYKRCLANH